MRSRPVMCFSVPGPLTLVPSTHGTINIVWSSMAIKATRSRPRVCSHQSVWNADFTLSSRWSGMNCMLENSAYLLKQGGHCLKMLFHGTIWFGLARTLIRTFRRRVASTIPYWHARISSAQHHLVHFSSRLRSRLPEWAHLSTYCRTTTSYVNSL